MNKFAKSFFTVSIIGIITRGLSFIYRMILTRTLSSYQLGIYQLTISVFFIFITLTSSGIPLAISRLSSNSIALNKDKTSNFTMAGLFISLSLAGISIIFINLANTIFYKIFSNQICYILLKSLCPAIVFSAVYSSLRASFWGRKKFFTYSIIELFEEFSALIILSALAIFCTNSKFTQSFPIFATNLSFLIAAILAVVLYLIQNGKVITSKIEILEICETATPITSVRLLTSLSSSFLALILPHRLMLFGLTHQCALETIGLFSGVVIPLCFIPSTLIGSLALILVPQLSENLAKGKNLTSTLTKCYTFTIMTSALIVPIFISVPNQLCGILFSKAEAGPYLRFSAFAIIPLCINQISIAILNSIGGEKYGFINFVIGIIIAFTCVFFLTPHLSIYASIISMIIQPTIISILNIKRITKMLKIDIKKIASVLLYGLIFIPISIIALFTNSLLYFAPNILKIIITSIISVILMFIFAKYLGLFNINSVHKIIDKK